MTGANTVADWIHVWAMGLHNHQLWAFLVPFFVFLFFRIVTNTLRGPRNPSPLTRRRYASPHFCSLCGDAGHYTSQCPPSPHAPAVKPAPEPPRYRLPGHAGNCRCGLCNPAGTVRDGQAGGLRPARPGETGQVTGRPQQMPPPSDRTEPEPCRHDGGVFTVETSDRLRRRYTCANPACDAVWPPDQKFPPGTLINGEPS
jgi:hypothetical protein